MMVPSGGLNFLRTVFNDLSPEAIGEEAFVTRLVSIAACPTPPWALAVPSSRAARCPSCRTTTAASSR